MKIAMEKSESMMLVLVTFFGEIPNRRIPKGFRLWWLSNTGKVRGPFM
jgi:hypothetical protein